VVVFPLFHLTVPVLFAPLSAPATVTVQLSCEIFVTELLTPLVIPATPVQPLKLGRQRDRRVHLG